MTIEKLLEKSGAQELRSAVAECRQNPVVVRNAIAEQGVEMTPSQLGELVEFLDSLGDSA